MAPGRRLVPKTPEVPENEPGRLTRQSLTIKAGQGVSSRVSLVSDSSINSSQPAKRPRGRPPRASLAAAMESSPALVEAASLATRRLRPRNSSSSVAGSRSASTAPTTLDATSEGESSTRASTQASTPISTASSATPKSRLSNTSIQVHIPSSSALQPDSERLLRTSVYSINHAPKHTKRQFQESDDEDELIDMSRDSQVARRLQREENAIHGTRLSKRIAPQTIKDRIRATRASMRQNSSAKRVKVVEDSESQDDDLSDAKPELGLVSVVSEHDVSPRDEEFESDGDESYEDSPSEDELANRAPRPNTTTGTNPSFVHPIDEFLSNPITPATLGFSDPEDASSAINVVPIDDGSSDSDDDNSRRLVLTRPRGYRAGNSRRMKKERSRLEHHHPEIVTMWTELEKMPLLKPGKAEQPSTISRRLKPFQLEGLAWMKEMEKTKWKGGLLGDEMGLGKTIQAVSLIMSDYPAKQPSLVLVPPVALMQWQSEIKSYTDGTLKTFVFHTTNQQTKGITAKELRKYDVIMMSYNSLESMYRKQEKGFKRKAGLYKEKSVIHSIHFHRVILDEAHCIKTRTTMTAKACFALKTDYRWCLTGTPLQNRIGEFFSLVRFLNMTPFASYLCKQCSCSSLEWQMNDVTRCRQCDHAGMQHVSVFNQELLNPIQKFGNYGPGRQAFSKLRLMTGHIMLRRLKKDHTNSMELPVKEVYVDRQFFGEEENDFANSIMTNGQRKFDTYVAQGVLLNNYANIFGLIMQMRQVADHPDLILKKDSEGGQNVLVCCICDEPAEDTVRSRCKHDFCRACVTSYVHSTEQPDCPRCHIALSIDLEQPEIEQEEALMKKNSIINRIKMDKWTSSSKIELLVHELHRLRSDNASHKSIIFSQFTTMLQLIEWRLRRAGITTVMLDGSMTPAQRQASIEHFMNNVDVECFLVSLKAGGVALNLTEASRVFIVDPWWNPAAEWQSADRCHRIGQTRPCSVTRLCIEDSVESRMVLIQEKKTSMINSTVNADDKAMDSLSPEDMQFLFRGS
ncbi:hypothetical protein CDD81_7954 [Ophiocordyceps australis]|uniref:DNA repair protein RAD16 n=1 Tax=Ophiocordyceps australis TaxID=1399860 RepID=A0A2C5Y306_9HYPO|nr:hypothetical protein CDD81_7954 [Ophiocordyceps australis]